jgi:hypothetical protein
LDAYWQATRTPRREESFVLQLRGLDGQILASRTVPPADDYAPTQWSRGQIVRGQYGLRIPVTVPAGEYTCRLVPEQERPLRRLWPWSRPAAELCRVTVKPSEGERTFEIPAMQQTVGVNLNDQVELLGIDLETARVTAGGAVRCTLYWRALQTIDRNYTVFTHLVGADGQTWGQWDNEPQQGQSPTTRWVPGQVIADPYQIPVSADAPAGPIVLRVGMYDIQTMLRLPVIDANGQAAGDHIDLITIEVTRP